MTCGVYMITNKLTGEIYIGGSTKIEERWHNHKIGSKRISKLIKEIGFENFTFTLLEKCSPEEVWDREKYYIKKYDSRNNGLNLTDGGENNFNSSGYYHVSIQRNNNVSSGIIYRYHDSNTGRYISSININDLKEKVKENGFKWMVVDEKKAKETNRISDDNQKRHDLNNTGFYRVHKHKNENCTQGFFYVYQYMEDGSQKQLTSTNIHVLKEKVMLHNLKWKVLNAEKASKTIAESESNNKNYVNMSNKTGFYRVQLRNCAECKNGRLYVYQYRVDGKNNSVSSTNIFILEKKVKSKGWVWKVLDYGKAFKTISMNLGYDKLNEYEEWLNSYENI